MADFDPVPSKFSRMGLCYFYNAKENNLKHLKIFFSLLLQQDFHKLRCFCFSANVHYSPRIQRNNKISTHLGQGDLMPFLLVGSKFKICLIGKIESATLYKMINMETQQPKDSVSANDQYLNI